MRVLALLMTLVMVQPDQWAITWEPHPENKVVRVIYRCETGTPFYAFNQFDITPDQSSAIVHRLEIPEESTTCWAVAHVVRGETFNPDTEYVGEYTLARVK